MHKDKEADGASARQCNLFGAPDPLRPQPARRHGVESFLGPDLKDDLRATCARMQVPMSKFVRAVVRFCVSEIQLPKPIGSSKEFRTRIVATDNQAQRPRGNPSKGGQTAAANRKLKADNPQAPDAK